MLNKCREQIYAVYPPSGIADDSGASLYSTALFLHVPFFYYFDFNEVLGTRIFTIHVDGYLNSSKKKRNERNGKCCDCHKNYKEQCKFFSPFCVRILFCFFFLLCFSNRFVRRIPFFEMPFSIFFHRIIKFEAMRLTVMSSVTCYLFSMQINSKSNFFNDGLPYLRTCIPTTFNPTCSVPRNFSFVSIRYPVTLELERKKRISRALFNDDCVNGVRRTEGDDAGECSMFIAQSV